MYTTSRASRSSIGAGERDVERAFGGPSAASVEV
jgi:hypothetical protein